MLFRHELMKDCEASGQSFINLLDGSAPVIYWDQKFVLQWLFALWACIVVLEPVNKDFLLVDVSPGVDHGVEHQFLRDWADKIFWLFQNLKVGVRNTLEAKR